MSNLRYGKLARTAREAAGLSRERVAQLADVSTSTITRLENEDRVPNALTLSRIAAAIGVTTSYLLDELDEYVSEPCS